MEKCSCSCYDVVLLLLLRRLRGVGDASSAVWGLGVPSCRTHAGAELQNPNHVSPQIWTPGRRNKNILTLEKKNRFDLKNKKKKTFWLWCRASSKTESWLSRRRKISLTATEWTRPYTRHIQCKPYINVASYIRLTLYHGFWKSVSYTKISESVILLVMI